MAAITPADLRDGQSLIARIGAADLLVDPDLFGRAMEQLADRTLAKIDDGELNPTVHLQ
jgi:hypothetical protein